VEHKIETAAMALAGDVEAAAAWVNDGGMVAAWNLVVPTWMSVLCEVA